MYTSCDSVKTHFILNDKIILGVGEEEGQYLMLPVAYQGEEQEGALGEGVELACWEGGQEGEHPQEALGEGACPGSWMVLLAGVA